MVKLIYCVRKKSALTTEEFQRYWKENHANMIRGFAQTIKATKYIQSYTLDTPVTSQLMGSRGITEKPYDGVTEIWWNSMQDLIDGVSTPEGQETAMKYVTDEGNFIDFSESRVFMTEEYTVFDLTNG